MPPENDRSPLAVLGLFVLGGVFVLAIVAALLLAVLMPVALSGLEDDSYAQAETAAAAAAEYFIEEGFAASKLDADEPLLTQRTIVIAEAINERTARHVVERLLHLNGLDREQPINLFITTNGGWQDSAFAIIDTMERIDAPVNTIAIGGCYSAGSMILVAGTGTRSASRNCFLSIHAYAPIENPPPYDLDPIERKRFADLYFEHSKTPREFLEVDEESQPYFTAQEALEWGIIDKIEGDEEPQAGE